MQSTEECVSEAQVDSRQGVRRRAMHMRAGSLAAASHIDALLTLKTCAKCSFSRLRHRSLAAYQYKPVLEVL